MRDATAAQGVTLDFELDRDGCPEGWAQSGYARSVAEFMGSRSDTGWVPSLRLTRRMLRDKREPTRLLDAVAIAEAQHDGAMRLIREAASHE